MTEESMGVCGMWILRGQASLRMTERGRNVPLGTLHSAGGEIMLSGDILYRSPTITHPLLALA